MRILSHILNNDSPEYGGVKKIKIQHSSEIILGDSCNKLCISMELHTGTHIDYPYHFCNSGKNINDYVNSAIFIFKNWALIDCKIPNDKIIRSLNLSEYNNNVECLLIRSGWEKIRELDKMKYSIDGPGLFPDLAFKLKSHFPKLKCVGVDFISLTSFAHRKLGRIAHKSFLCDNDILIIEDMHLKEVRQSDENLYIIPWQVDGADGVPVTVFMK